MGKRATTPTGSSACALTAKPVLQPKTRISSITLSHRVRVDPESLERLGILRPDVCLPDPRGPEEDDTDLLADDGDEHDQHTESMTNWPGTASSEKRYGSDGPVHDMIEGKDGAPGIPANNSKTPQKTGPLSMFLDAFCTDHPMAG